MKYQLMTAKGQPNGFAGLDGAGLVPSAQLPSSGGGVTDHGALTGLTDDDHAQYALADGTRGTFEVAGAVAAHEAASDPHVGYQRESEKASANGYASLDANTRVPSAQLGTGTPDATTFLRGDQAWAVPAGGGAGQCEVSIFAPTAAVALTNQANAEQFLTNGSHVIRKADLTSYTQVRLLVRVTTGSASANNPRIYLEYFTSFSTTVSNYLAIGASAVNCSLTAAGLIDSGWINLVAGAKADVFLAVLQNGGNASADPALSWVAAQFK